MRTRYVVIALVWAVSLGLTATWTGAQSRPRQWTPLAEPVVKTGDELGFRVEWMYGRVPVGHLVIRQNDQWVDVRVGEPGDRQVLPALPLPPPAPPATPPVR